VTENSVQEALNGLASSARTTLVIAHRLGTIRNAHQICVIGDGKVEELGTHDELMEMKGMYAELWNMQLKNVHGQGDANPTK
jgi:ATP-binding cassette subfamily B protein